MTAEDEAKLILKQHAESTRIRDRKNCPNNFSSPNYITRNDTAGRRHGMQKIQVIEEDIEAEEAIIFKLIILRQLYHRNIQRKSNETSPKSSDAKSTTTTTRMTEIVNQVNSNNANSSNIAKQRQ